MFNKKFELKLYVPEHWETAEDMKARWRDNSKNAAQVAYKRLTKKIGFDEAFIDKMAVTSNKAYRDYVNPTYMSKGGRTAQDMINAQIKNMQDKYPRWIKNLARAYAEVDGIPAKAYLDKIDAATEDWAYEVGKKSLRLTGDRIGGRSVVAVALYYLVGDPRASGWHWEADKADGAPYNIARDYERSALKAALAQFLVQTGTLVLNANYQEEIMKEQNKRNTSLLNKLRDPSRCEQFVDAVADDKSFCLWEMDGNLFLLHLQVGLTTS